MIDEQFIESAKQIRREYLLLVNTLNKYEDDIKGLGNFLLEKVSDLTKYNDDLVKKIKSKEEVSMVTTYLLKEIENIETEERKIYSKVEEINRKMEKLKNEQNILQVMIKERHPQINDIEIKNYIQSQLEK
jgi:chromosome segregation ATPase